MILVISDDTRCSSAASACRTRLVTELASLPPPPVMFSESLQVRGLLFFVGYYDEMLN